MPLDGAHSIPVLVWVIHSCNDLDDGSLHQWAVDKTLRLYELRYQPAGAYPSDRWPAVNEIVEYLVKKGYA